MAKNECPHNSGVTCPEGDRHCQACGWSEEGAQRRQKRKSASLHQTEDLSQRRKPGKARQVAKIDEFGNVIELYPSIVMAATVNRMSQQTVKNHLAGDVKRPFKRTGGYSFRYADCTVPQ